MTKTSKIVEPKCTRELSDSINLPFIRSEAQAIKKTPNSELVERNLLSLEIVKDKILLSLDPSINTNDLVMFIDNMMVNAGFETYCIRDHSQKNKTYAVYLPDYLLIDRSTCILKFETVAIDRLVTSIDIASPHKYFQKPGIEGNLEFMNEERIKGWIVTQGCGGKVKFDLYVDDKFQQTIIADERREDVFQHFGDRKYIETGFDIVWNPHKSAKKFEIRESDSDQSLLGTPITITTLDDSVRCLERALQYFRAEGRPNPFGSTNSLEEIFKSIRELPHSQMISTPTEDLASRQVQYGISVIVPVYNGYDVLKDCIDSLMQSGSVMPYEIIIIDDCSPDERISTFLTEKQRALPNLFVINRHKNGGFVSSTNLGLKARRFKHAVILNSDTLVPKLFTDRILKAYESSPEFGVLTPLSNNATIYSFPDSAQDNSISGLNDIYRVDEVLRKENITDIHEMPTGHGYCMFLSYEVLNSVGGFDEEKWGLGYGEENDFCQKAKMAGLKIGAMTNMYVGHVGSVSFGAELRDQQVKKNLGLLNQRYPEYDQLINSHISSGDKFRGALNRLRMSLLGKELNDRKESIVAFVTHTLGGGTDEYINRTARELTRDKVKSIKILVDSDKHIIVSDHENKFSSTYKITEYQNFIEDLEQLSIEEILLNSIFTMPFKMIDAIVNSGIPYSTVIHDYSWACPKINLIDARGSYCGMPEPEVCNTCIRISGFHTSIARDWKAISEDVSLWQSKSLKVLKSARMVICPSKDTERRMLDVFPGINTQVRYHEDAFPIPVVTESVAKTNQSKALHKQTIAIFGRIGYHKGMAVIKNLIWLLSSRHEGIEFVFYGELAEYSWLENYSNVSFAGEYDKESLGEMVSKKQPSIALFLSVWPETYCYALTDAIRNGVFPVAFDIGAFKERVKMHNYGGVIPFTTDSESVYQSLVNLLCSEQFLNSKIENIKSGVHYKSMMYDCFDCEIKVKNQKLSNFDKVKISPTVHM